MAEARLQVEEIQQKINLLLLGMKRFTGMASYALSTDHASVSDEDLKKGQAVVSAIPPSASVSGSLLVTVVQAEGVQHASRL